MCARKAAPQEEELEVLDGFTPEEAGLLPLVQFNHKEEVFEIGLDGLDPEVAANLPKQVMVNGRARSTEVRDVRHTGGKVPMFLTPALHMAVVAMRQPIYFRKGDGGVEDYAPAGMKDPIAQGYRSRLRLLVLVQELGEAAGHPMLAMLTLKSSSAGDFKQVYWKAFSVFHKAAQRTLAQHYYELAQAARKGGQPDKADRYLAASRTARALPRSAFYIPFVVGKGQATAEGGTQTPIGHALPDEDVTVADAKALLIPAEARSFLQDPTIQEQIEAFTAERERGEGNGSGYVEEEEEEEVRPGNHGGTHNGLLRVRVTLSQADQDVPVEYAGLLGKTFGEIVAHPDGPNFLYWLTNEYEPRCAGDSKIVEAAHQVTGN